MVSCVLTKKLLCRLEEPMNRMLRRMLSTLLALSLAAGLTLPAAASEALGEDLVQQETQLNRETLLSRNVFWSTAFTDLRTEHFITYIPNADVTPIVTSGEVLRTQETVSEAAARIEAAGYRVVAGINGDFYNTSNGLPIGLVVTGGELRSSDAGHYGIGFRADGTAVLGKPAVKVTADLGYHVDEGIGTPTQIVRQITGVNKARVSDGGIYVYTHDFNSAHTTGTTEAGVDVVCTVTEGQLAIGETLVLTVDQVLDGVSATPIAENQVVLSANLLSNSYYVDALRNVPVGTSITLTLTAADEAWNDVEYAVGALYSLVENGTVVSGLAAGANPRTAVGQKADGTLVFYTIDGRRSGHSVGASLTQVAERLIELGCVTALCLDGGGSTTLVVTPADSVTAETVNTPSGASERAVTNQIFLVASAEGSGRLSHFHVEADHTHVLAGSKVNITATAVDTNYIPMKRDASLTASAGSLRNGVLTTPAEGGEITVTARMGGASGSTTVYAVAQPDDLVVKNASGAVKSITVTPGTVMQLTGAVSYNHLPLHADPELFTWTADGGIGTIDETGKFVAGAPGTGKITVTAGGKTAEVEVTVARIPLKTVEDFEGETTIFDGTGNGLVYTLTRTESQVQRGRAAAKLEYTLSESNGYLADWRMPAPVQMDAAYSALNLWVCGDGSGNILYLYYSDGTKDWLKREIAVLDFAGWQQVSVPVTEEYFYLQGLCVDAGSMTVVEDGLGGLIPLAPETPTIGWVYLDHVVASFAGTVDTEVPEVTVKLEEPAVPEETEEPTMPVRQVTASVSDAVDGILKRQSVAVTCNGEAVDFEYDTKTGEVLFVLPENDGTGRRITVTARDASGNIGRASVDVESDAAEHNFTDIADYWGASFVDFLYDAGITTGYTDGTFRPNQNISRAQFAVMLYRYLGLEDADYEAVELPFADNSKIPEYAVPAIRALYTKGIVGGSVGKDGKLYFNPNNALTRAQASAMIGRTQEKGYATVELTFTDGTSIPSYAQYFVSTMAAQGIINGYADGTFKPNNNITRGQMAKILYNMM